MKSNVKLVATVGLNGEKKDGSLCIAQGCLNKAEFEQRDGTGLPGMRVCRDHLPKDANVRTSS